MLPQTNMQILSPGWIADIQGVGCLMFQNQSNKICWSDHLLENGFLDTSKLFRSQAPLQGLRYVKDRLLIIKGSSLWYRGNTAWSPPPKADQPPDSFRSWVSLWGWPARAEAAYILPSCWVISGTCQLITRNRALRNPTPTTSPQCLRGQRREDKSPSIGLQADRTQTEMCVIVTVSCARLSLAVSPITV